MNHNKRQHQENEVLDGSTVICGDASKSVPSKDSNVAPTETLIYSDMDLPGEASGGHRYGIINLFDNATAIVGNSYGTSEGSSILPKQQQSAALQVYGLPGELGTNVFNTLKLFDTSRASVKEFRRLKKARKYALEIGVQKTIVKNAVQALLLPYTGVDGAEQMLLDPRHPNWTKNGVLQYLDQRLRGSVDVLEHTLELINSDLLSVAGFVRERVSSGGKSTQSIRSTLNTSGLPKISTSGTQLTQEMVIKALQNLNSRVIQFQTHLQQCAQQQERVHESEPCAESKIKVDRYKKIQEAAQDLYQAFGRACQQHPKHRARLHLQALSENRSHVQFSLLLEESGALNSRTSIPDMTFRRLTIESQINGLVQYPETCATAGQKSSLKRIRYVTEDENATKKSQKARRKRASFALSTKSLRLPSLTRGRASEIFPNFCISGRLCLHMKTILDHGGCDDIPLGYMHNQGCSKHLIYLRSRNQAINPQSLQNPPLWAGGDLSPLRIIFQTVEQKHRMSKTDLSSFAKQLAMAVLQYHATPWLESLDSDHILVGDHNPRLGRSEDVSKDYSRSCPSDSYLEVSINNPNTTSRTPVTDRSRTLIRNWILFSLGVMLLELAYQKPLRDLQEPYDFDPHNEHNTDFFTADRLQKRTAADTGMGSVYAEVIRKCIHCDFGHGFDLSASKLQEGYYEDVIQKLENIETGMKNLGL